MALPTAAVGTAWTSPEAFLAALTGGYFAFPSYGTADAIALVNVDDPTTVVDTYATGAIVQARSAQTINGTGYFIHNTVVSGDYTLLRVAQAGGALDVDVLRSGDITWQGEQFAGIYPTPDESQVVLTTNTTDRGIGLSTVDGTEVYNVNLTTLGHNRSPIATPAADRFLVGCGTHQKLELWDAVGETILDEISDRIFGDNTYLPQGCTAVGTDRVLFYGDIATDTLPKTMWAGVISTAGDVISWEWGPTQFDTDWGASSSSSDIGVAAGVWGPTGIALLLPYTRFGSGTYVASSPIVMDTTTGDYSASAATEYNPQGTGFWASSQQQFIGFAGPNRVVKIPGSSFSPPALTWAITTPRGPRRRAIGTSYHLRQRQTPYIR